MRPSGGLRSPMLIATRPRERTHDQETQPPSRAAGRPRARRAAGLSARRARGLPRPGHHPGRAFRAGRQHRPRRAADGRPDRAAAGRRPGRGGQQAGRRQRPRRRRRPARQAGRLHAARRLGLHPGGRARVRRRGGALPPHEGLHPAGPLRSQHHGAGGGGRQRHQHGGGAAGQAAGQPRQVQLRQFRGRRHLPPGGRVLRLAGGRAGDPRPLPRRLANARGRDEGRGAVRRGLRSAPSSGRSGTVRCACSP